MAQPQGGMSSFQFKDPFDLLSDLHNARFQFMYKNEFARGSRPNFNDVGGGGVNLPASEARTRLPVNAPMSEMVRRAPIRGGLPAPRQLTAPQNFGTPPVEGGEEDRMGATVGPLAKEGIPLAQKLYGNYKFNKQYGADVQRLSDLDKQQAQVGQQYDNLKETIEINKNLAGMREQSRQSQAQLRQQDIASRVQGNLPNVVASVTGDRTNPANVLEPTVASANRMAMGRLNTLETQAAAAEANANRPKGSRTIQDVVNERNAERFAGTRSRIPTVTDPSITPEGSPYGMLGPTGKAGSMGALPSNVSDANRKLLESLDEAYASQGSGGAPALPSPSQMPTAPGGGGGSFPSFPIVPNPNQPPAGPSSPFPQPKQYDKGTNTQALGGGLIPPAPSAPRPSLADRRRSKGRFPRK
jgi:hypothetical protein